MENTPRDDAARHQIALDVDGGLAHADYAIDGAVMTFMHTFVPEPSRGHGVATRLVEAGLETARRKGLKVDPQCPDLAQYMQAHPETGDLLAGS